MNGGDGVDTVIDKGGNVAETFVIKPKVGDPTRVDASRDQRTRSRSTSTPRSS